MPNACGQLAHPSPHLLREIGKCKARLIDQRKELARIDRVIVSIRIPKPIEGCFTSSRRKHHERALRGLYPGEASRPSHRTAARLSEGIASACVEDEDADLRLPAS